MKIGIRAHDLGAKKNFIDVAESVKDLGLSAVQLVLNKAVPPDANEKKSLSEEFGKRIRSVFETKGIDIALLGAYFNWYHDEEDAGLNNYIEHLKFASSFGTMIVGTESQGIRKDRWGHSPENETPEAFERAVHTARRLVDAAEKYDALAGFEGACSHVLSSPRKVIDLVDRMESDNIALIFDLYNFLNLKNTDAQREIIDETLELYGSYLKVVHCKDFIHRGDHLKQTALGEGDFDYPYLIRRLKENHLDNVTLILEGITGEEVRKSLDYLRPMI